MNLKISSIELLDETMPFNKKLIGQNIISKFDNEYETLNMNVQTISKANPSYSNIDSVTDIRMYNIKLAMQPNTINHVIKFFKNTRPGQSFNLIE